MITMKVLAFGIVKEIFSSSSIDLEFDNELTVAALKRKLETQYPKLKALASYAVAVNDEYAESDLVIKVNDEVAIIPPVSGG